MYFQHILKFPRPFPTIATVAAECSNTFASSPYIHHFDEINLQIFNVYVQW